MEKRSREIYSFDEFRLDLTRGSLFRGVDEVKLRPKSFEVLRYLTQNSGRLVTKDELIGFVWHDTAVTDDSLVQCMKDIRCALDDGAHAFIKTVPRRGYIFEKEVTGNGGSYYLEETSRVHLVIEETDETQRTTSTWIVEQVGRHKFAAAFAIVTLCSIVAAALLARPVLQWYLKPPSIAVLPIVNSTGEASLEYLADGLTDSIIISLNQLNENPQRPRLKVAALNTVFLFKGKELDPREIGQRLGMDTVLASKMFDENGLRVFKFELINSNDGSILWHGQYAVTIGRPAEFVDKQNEIPGAIAAQFPLRLSYADKQKLTRRYTQNGEAYDAYLRGRAAALLITPSSVRRSIEEFQHAIDLDPNFALAYWAEGMSYRVQGMIDERPDNEANEKAVNLFQTSLKIDNALTVAIEGMKLNEAAVGDWEAIKKGGSTHPAYADYLTAAGRMDELIDDQKHRLSINPYGPLLNWNHCNTLFFAQRYSEAIAQCQKTLNLVPESGKGHFGVESPWTHLILADAYSELGKHDQAIAEGKMTVGLAEDSPAMTAMLGYFYAKAGNREEAFRILDSLNKRMEKGEYVPPLNLAWLYGSLGDNDNAFNSLYRALDEHETKLFWFKACPPCEPFKSDPRYGELLERLHLPD